MNNEIKEILEALKPQDEEFTKAGIKEYPLYLRPDQQRILLDYITNLQTIEQQYSAILSENAELENKITNLQEENEKLKNGYCDLKVKCNNGECDCTNEEYEDMVQANMRGSLLLEDYKSRNEKAIEYIEYVKTLNQKNRNNMQWEYDILFPELANILQGDDKSE